MPSVTRQRRLPSFHDIILFIRENDTHNRACGGDFTDVHIIRTLHDAVECKCLYFAWDSYDETRLSGIVVGKPDYETKTMHIPFVVTNESDILLRFLARFQYEFPQWNLSGLRRGVNSVWDSDKIYCMILKLIARHNLSKMKSNNQQTEVSSGRRP